MSASDSAAATHAALSSLQEEEEAAGWTIPTPPPVLEDSERASSSFDYSPLSSAGSLACTPFQCTAPRALLEFQRLVDLKVMVNDADGTKIRPTELMDHMWKHAVLDTKFYDALSEHIGMRLHRSPSVPVIRSQEDAAFFRRLYQLRFDEKPHEVEAPAAVSTTPSAESAPADSSSTASSSKPFYVFVKMLSGKGITLTPQPSDTIAQLKQQLFEKEGIPVDQQRVIFTGKLMNNAHTLTECQIMNESTVHVILNLRC